jgi:hypothetical protein
MATKSYSNQLVFLVNILAIVTLGYIIRFSHSLPEYFHDAGLVVQKSPENVI